MTTGIFFVCSSVFNRLCLLLAPQNGGLSYQKAKFVSDKLDDEEQQKKSLSP
ncbi:MAG: hypothetical protein AB1611_21750 [bacterium]